MAEILQKAEPRVHSADPRVQVEREPFGRPEEAHRYRALAGPAGPLVPYCCLGHHLRIRVPAAGQLRQCRPWTASYTRGGGNLERQLGLDQPPVELTSGGSAGAAQGDFGQSFSTRDENVRYVSDMIGPRLTGGDLHHA